jgi:pimeloyl-ACP methyl ester carboxylesterase
MKNREFVGGAGRSHRFRSDGVSFLRMLAIRRDAHLETLPKPAALPMADESGLAPVDDIQMWYAIFNKSGSNPVLLIHGGLINADTWGNQVPVLAKTHQVIVADSRGHGRSTRSSKPFGYELMADDYLALLDHLKIDKVAIVVASATVASSGSTCAMPIGASSNCGRSARIRWSPV